MSDSDKRTSGTQRKMKRRGTTGDSSPDEGKRRLSQSSSSLQISPDLLRVLPVETFALFVEFLVSLVDVADVGVVNMGSSAAVFGTFRDLTLDVRRHFVQRRRAHFS